MTINERIFYLLNLQKRKQSELSEYTGIKPSTITDWKRKGTNPSSDSIFKISEFFNVNTDWILTGEGEMNKQTIDIQPKFSDEEKLDIGEKLLLKKYNQLDEVDKIEILDIITLKTLKGLKSKLYHSANAKDEVLTAYELERIAS